MMPMILTVYLSNNDRQGIEVPITPETCCKDVMDFCKEPGELQCRLVQLWRGDERALSAQEGIFDLLQQWGARRDEVKFFLRHDVASLGSRDPGRTVGGHVAGHPASGTKQEMKDLSVITEAQRLQQLRERVESQEAKIRKLRSMRGLPEHPKVLNHNLLAELSTMNGFLAEKQRELAAAVTRVDELTKQLESVRSGRPDGHQLGLGRQLASAVLDLDRLYRELQMRNRVSQQQQQPQQQRNGETAEMERRVGELRQQMLRKKAAMAAGDPRSASECSRLLGTRIATVGPFQTNVRPDGPESTAYKAYPSNQQLVAQCGVGNDNAKPEETDKGTITKGAWAESNLDGSDAVAVHPRGVLSAHPEPSSLPAHPGMPLTHERQLMGGMDWKESSLDIPAKGPTQSTSPGPLGFDVGIASRVSKTDLSLATTSTAQDAPGHRQSWAGIGSSVLPKPQPPGPMEQPRPAFIRFQGTLERRIPQPGQQSRLQGPGQATGWPWSGGGVHALQKGHLSAPQSLQEVPRTSRQIQQRIAVPPSTTSVQPQRSSSPALSSNSSSSSSLQQLFQPSSITTHTVSSSPTHSGPVHSLDSHSSSPGPLAERSQSPRKLAPPLSLNSSSIMSMYTQQAQQPRFLQQALINAMGKAQGRQSPALPRIGGPPAPPRGTAYDQQYNPTNFYGMMKPLSPDELDRKMERPRSASGMNWGLEPQRPLSPTKLLPFSMSPLRGQGDADLEALRRKLAHAPRPLKKRSSFAEPESPAGSSMSNLMHLSNVPSLLLQKLHYQRVTLAGLEGTVQGQGVPHHANQEPSAVTTHPSFLEYQSQYGRPSHGEVPHGPGSDPQSPPPVPAPPSNELTGDLAELTEPSSFNRNGGEAPPIPPLPQEVSEDPSCELDTLHEQVDFGAIEEEAESGFRFSDSYASDEEDLDFIDDLEPPVVYPPIIPPDKRTNLKKVGSERTNSGIRVKFNPLALLLDASLEGEFDLVQRIIYEVDNPSHPNDEGITALHNAVCAGHVAIVRFLIQFGVNVNAGDSDGWTPLHCAASCNSTSMCRLLVESGAAPFATTQSDMETAAEKCDDFEEGYEECFQFLYGVQEKMGVMNKGLVYVLWSWDAEAPDELSIHEGEQLLVLRRGDKDETEWWWLQQGDKEGYIPRNMLGLFPRIRPRQRSLA